MPVSIPSFIARMLEVATAYTSFGSGNLLMSEDVTMIASLRILSSWPQLWELSQQPSLCPLLKGSAGISCSLVILWRPSSWLRTHYTVAGVSWCELSPEPVSHFLLFVQSPLLLRWVFAFRKTYRSALRNSLQIRLHPEPVVQGLESFDTSSSVELNSLPGCTIKLPSGVRASLAVERILLIPVSLRFQYDEIPNTLFGILYLEYSIWNTLFGILYLEYLLFGILYLEYLLFGIPSI